MASREIITTLSLLSQREREVLARKCGGLDYKTIGQQLHIAIPTVKADMGRVYVKLRLDQLAQAERLRMLFEVYCPALRTTELPIGLPEIEEEEPAPLQIMVVNMVEDDERALIPYTPHYPAYAPSQPEIISARPIRRPKPLRWMVFGMILGALLMVGIFFALRGMGIGVVTQPALIQTSVVTQIAEVTVVLTPTPAPEQPTIPAVQEETVVTQEVIVVVTATPPPETPTPELTDAPTPEGMTSETFVVPSYIARSRGWMETDIFLQQGDHVSIRYISGTWWIGQKDWSAQEPVDANGYVDRAGDRAAALVSSDPNKCKVLSDAPYGSLIGRIGNPGPTFLIGNSYDSDSTADGLLYVGFNFLNYGSSAECPNGDGGEITVSVEVVP